MSSRLDHLNSFLETAGWSGAQRHPLAGDASFRRYERITLGSQRAVLGCPARRGRYSLFWTLVTCDLWVIVHLKSLLKPCKTGSFCWNFGDTTFTRLQSGMDERPMYEGAVDLLVD